MSLMPAWLSISLRRSLFAESQRRDESTVSDLCSSHNVLPMSRGQFSLSAIHGLSCALQTPLIRNTLIASSRDSLAGLARLLPALSRQEAIFVGEAAALPTRVIIRTLDRDQLPHSDDVPFSKGWSQPPVSTEQITQVVRRCETALTASTINSSRKRLSGGNDNGPNSLSTDPRHSSLFAVFRVRKHETARNSQTKPHLRDGEFPAAIVTGRRRLLSVTDLSQIHAEPAPKSAKI